MTLAKREARQQQIASLRTLPDATRQAEQAQLLRQLFTLPAWQHAHTVATTISGEFELDTSGIINATQMAHKTVLVPKTMPHRQLAFLPFTTRAELVTSNFGIPEPAYKADQVDNHPDLIIVPGLAFTDASRSRLGFGGGYYDRFLASFNGTTVSLALSVQLRPENFWVHDAFDIPIQHIITIK